MKTVLIIEDNDIIRENTAEILEMSNYKVLTAPDGKAGVALAIEHVPDIIICDIMMPVLDGYGVIHLLQKNEATQDIPFIFLSAKAERLEIRKGMELGADDYITKPFSDTELLNAIETRLKKSEIIQKKISGGVEGVAELIDSISGKEQFNRFLDEKNTTSFKKKQVVYYEGSNPYRMYYLKKGKVRGYKTNEDGKEISTDLYSEGDFFGFVSLLEGTTNKESTQTLEDCEIVVISKEDFDTLINTNRHVMQKFIKLLANNVIEKEQQLLNIAYNSLRKKVADALLSVYNKYGIGVENYSIDISRDNLASIAGTAKESLIRTLGDFKSEQLIDVVSGSIYILNEKKLAGMIN